MVRITHKKKRKRKKSLLNYLLKVLVFFHSIFYQNYLDRLLYYTNNGLLNSQWKVSRSYGIYFKEEEKMEMMEKETQT